MRARQLLIRQHQLCICAFQLRLGLRELNCIRLRIYGEEQIAFMNYSAILEINSGQYTADLRSKFDTIDGRELSEESQLFVDLPFEGIADDDLWERLSASILRASPIAEQEETARPHSQNEQKRHGCSNPYYISSPP